MSLNKERRILVTGGAGFIGAPLVQHLVSFGHHLAVVDHFSTRGNRLPPETVCYHVDITSPDLSEVFAKERPHVVFHLAGPINLRKSVDDPAFERSSNIIGDIRNVLDAARTSGVTRFVFVSSGGAICADATLIPTPEDYPCAPKTVYGIANLLIETYIGEYCRVHEMDYVIVRLGNVFGPGQWSTGLIPSVIRAFLKNEELVLEGDGTATRDFLFIDDAVDALSRATFGKKSHVSNAASGTEVCVNEILSMVLAYFDKKPSVRYTGIPPVAMRNALDITRIREELGWEPKVPVDDSVRRTFASLSH